MYVFECRAECRTHSSIFKVCFILNAELNVELTARYSRCMFSNAELNVEPIARYSKCVLFWMQSWTSISQLDILIFLVLLVEYRAEYRSHSSIFADYVCEYIAEYRFSIPLPTSQTLHYNKECMYFDWTSWCRVWLWRLRRNIAFLCWCAVKPISLTHSLWRVMLTSFG